MSSKINQKALDDAQWEIVEEPVSQTTKNVLTMMSNYIKNYCNNTNDFDSNNLCESLKRICYDDYNIYDEIRNQIKEYNFPLRTNKNKHVEYKQIKCRTDFKKDTNTKKNNNQ